MSDALSSPRGPERAKRLGGVPESSKLTPMFRQWLDAKRQYPDALLLFRMGDFYELFFDDARVAAPVLEVALTARGKGTDTEAAMCGVPHHAVRAHIARLVERGFRVAICEQMEDPKKAKGMVRREVVRVVSPGTLVDPEALEAGSANWLAALAPGDDQRGVALVDLSTGAMVLARARDERELADLLARYEVREILAPEDAAASLEPRLPEIRGRRPLLTPLPSDRFHRQMARERVIEGLGVHALSGFGCPDDHPGLPAAAAALAHLGHTQGRRPAHLDRLRVEEPERRLVLDHTTRRNLELVVNQREGGRRHTLLEVLDRSVTPMGARLMRAWLLEPSREVPEIRARLDVVEDLVTRPDLRADMRESLGAVRDVERLVGRAALGSAAPRDLAALERSLAVLPRVLATTGELPAPLLAELAERIDPLDDLQEALARALADEPGNSVGEGRVIREGYDAELDEARELARGGRQLIASLEQKEREETGISSLKVRYNRVFGYFIEVSKSNLPKVPERYERRQTLASGERYVTPEIKELEARILGAEERLAERERELFAGLVDAVVERAARLRTTAAALAELDVLAGLAEAAAHGGWTRPRVHDEDRLEIAEGRHPVVEGLLPAGGFVPNDVHLDEDERLLVVTGPNMGGKSTYLRQVALITIMAQLGSFVPAREASIGVVDRVFCRVGASDDLAGGESTFMVEMTETANILHNATPQSLVILDEIGRGTATWDGMAIAWAVVEALHDDPRLTPKALFATHYHELTELAARLPRLANVHIAVREHGHDVVFLHRVERGPSDRSYGIHVARLAGLPDRVVERARAILDDLSAAPSAPAKLFGREHPPQQLGLFETPALSPDEERALERLRCAQVDDLSPREAHALLAELVDALRRPS